MLDLAPTVLLTRVANTPLFTAPRTTLSGLARAVACESAYRLTGLRVEIGDERGRPAARWSDGVHRNPPPSLSFSYCPGWIAVAIAPRGRVGIDIEPRRSVSWRIAERVMSLPDAERLHRMPAGDRERAATHCWTAAEALAKADGRGLALMLDRVLRLDSPSSGSWDRYDYATTQSEAGIVCALAADRGADLTGALVRSTFFEPERLVA